MREILDEMLLLSRARQLIIEPSRAELDEAMDATRNRMGLTTEEAFLKALRGAGMTLDDFRERTSRSIRVNAVIQREVRAKIEMDDEWLQRAYREGQEEFRTPAKTKVQEIVIPTEKLSGDKAREVAEAMRTALAGGESMADVVARLGGGDATDSVHLGWGRGGRLRPGARGRRRRTRAGRGFVSRRGARRAPPAAGPGAHGKHRAPVLRGQENAGARGAEQALRGEDARRVPGLSKPVPIWLENTPPEAVGYREVTRDNPPTIRSPPSRRSAHRRRRLRRLRWLQRRQRRRRPAPVRRRRKIHP